MRRVYPLMSKTIVTKKFTQQEIEYLLSLTLTGYYNLKGEG